ncbi:Pro-resilin [Frankliniella fusca]|uniref:Pro-resilin n=1 Tax=Frankliniella fusca TaxID=407009 RepID=A0AAE1I035_9NEOP|nr:Pro-resilin [Frankliniella fusca]
MNKTVATALLLLLTAAVSAVLARPEPPSSASYPYPRDDPRQHQQRLQQPRRLQDHGQQQGGHGRPAGAYGAPPAGMTTYKASPIGSSQRGGSSRYLPPAGFAGGAPLGSGRPQQYQTGGRPSHAPTPATQPRFGPGGASARYGMDHEEDAHRHAGNGLGSGGFGSAHLGSGYGSEARGPSPGGDFGYEADFDGHSALFGDESDANGYGAGPESHRGHGQQDLGFAQGRDMQGLGHGQGHGKQSLGHGQDNGQQGFGHGQSHGKQGLGHGQDNGQQGFGHGQSHGKQGLAYGQGNGKQGLGRGQGHGKQGHGQGKQGLGYGLRQQAQSPRDMYGPPQGYPAAFNRLGDQDDDDDMSETAMYQFEYSVGEQQQQQQEVDDDLPQFGQHEERDGELTRGSYHVLLPDGRLQRVDYEADERGFRPTVSFEQQDEQGQQRGSRGGPY